MTTIITLPSPAPQGPRGTGAPTQGAPSASDFAAALEAVVGRSTRGEGSPADGDASAEQRAADGALVTVAQIVQAAAGLLAEVGGTGESAGTGDGDPTGEGESGEGESGEELAQVLDLTARLAAGTGQPATDAEGEESAAAATARTATSPGTPGHPAAGTQAYATAQAAPSAPGTALGAEDAAATSRATAATPAATAGADVPDEAVLARAAETVAAGRPTSGEGPPTAVPAATAPTATAGAVTAGAATPVAAVAPTAETAPTVPTQPTAPAAPAAPPEPPRALADQLGARLTSLRGAGEGQHVLTMRVDPESFGPVRVVAHISPEGVRIELLGATDQAREALRAALPDLRRDMVAAGFPADLGLGKEQGGSQTGSGRDLPDQRTRTGTAGGDATGAGEPDALPLTIDHLTGLPRGLDLLV